MKTLKSLAQDLNNCRRRHTKLSLRYVLEAGRILSEAKRLAKRRFGDWLRRHARMDRSTVSRYFRVAAFTERNGALMHQIEKLSITKICALASLADVGRGFLDGSLKLSRPLDSLSDAAFIKEIHERFPAPPKKRNRQHAFRQMLGAIDRLQRAFATAGRYHDELSALQRRRIAAGLRKLIASAGGWSVVA